MKHVHADLMKLYAEDATTSDTPWELWEFKYGGVWEDLSTHPAWIEESQYRRKVKMRNISGYQYPQPETLELDRGSKYYIPDIKGDDIITEYIWLGDTLDIRWLRRGLVHLTKEAASEHAKAIILATGGRV